MVIEKKLIERLFGSFIFLIIFYSISYTFFLAFETVKSNLIHQLIQYNYEELNDITAKIHSLVDPVIYYNDLLERLIRGLVNNNYLSDIVKKIPPSTKLYLFDENGKRIVCKYFSSDLIVSSEKFIRVIQKISTQTYPSVSKLDKRLLESFCGSFEASVKVAKLNNRLIDLTPYGFNKLVGWYKFSKRKKYTLFVIIEKTGIDVEKIFYKTLSEIQQKLSKVSNIYKIGYCAIHDKYRCYNAYQVELSENWQKLFSRRILPSNFRIKKLLFSVQQVGSKFIIFACKKLSYDDRRLNVLLSLKYFLIIVVFAVSLLTLLNLLFSYTDTISIKFQLIISFAIVGIISIGGLMVLTFFYYQNKQASIIRELLQESEMTLKRIDEEFLPFFNKYLVDYRAVLASSSEGYRFNILDKYFKNGFIEAAYALNKSEQVVLKFPQISKTHEEFFINQIFPILHRLAIQIIKRLVQKGYEKESNEVRTSSDMLNVLLERPIDGIIQHRATLQNMKVGILEKYAFVDYSVNEKNEIEVCLIILHDRATLQNLYLQNVQNFFNENKKDVIFMAIPVKKEDNSIEIFPHYSKFTYDVQHLINRVIKTNSQAIRRININDSEYLLVAIPATNIKGYVLILANNLEPTKIYIKKTSMFFNSIFLAILIFTVFISIHYGNSLIMPVVQLTKWLQEIQNMNFTVKVTINSNDELREIGDALNEIIEEKKEIELAKIVQDNLLPNSPIKISNISVWGVTVSSSELISEIYDYFHLSDRFLAFFVISSAVKGISSALLCAMCKMAIHLYLDIDKITDPSLILKNLDSYLRYIVKRPVNISVIFGVVDLNNMSATISVAGKWCIFHIKTENKFFEAYHLANSELCASFNSNYENTHINLISKGEKEERLWILSPKFYKITNALNILNPKDLLCNYNFNKTEKQINSYNLLDFAEQLRKLNFEMNILEDISILVIEKVKS